MEQAATNGWAFLQRVRKTGIAPGEIALWYIGGAGYIVRTASATLLVDPFIGPSNPPDWIRAIPPPFAPDELAALGPVDTVLITHEHGDHADPVALAAIAAGSGIPVLGTPAVVEVATSVGIESERAIVFPPDTSHQFADLTVTAVPMYDPMAQSANGYILETDGVTLLLCGDSIYFSGFRELGARWRFDAICLTVGLNPPGQTFYLDESGAARAARDSGAKTLIVQHYDLWQGITLDPARVRTACHWYVPETTVIPARFQRRITLGPAGATR